jgi:hypothetical protein
MALLAPGRESCGAFADKNIAENYSLLRSCVILYYADLWIMPTIGSERALAVAIAAMESA